MIDLRNQEYVTLQEAAKLLPGRPHISTIFRYASKGIKGVLLSTYKIGGRRVVAISDLEDFIEAVSAASNKQAAPKPQFSKQRQRRIEKAEAELAKLGITGNSLTNDTTADRGISAPPNNTDQEA